MYVNLAIPSAQKLCVPNMYAEVSIRPTRLVMDQRGGYTDTDQKNGDRASEVKSGATAMAV